MVPGVMADAGVLLPVMLSPLTRGLVPLHCDSKAGSPSRTVVTVSNAFLLEALTRSPCALSKVTPRASGAQRPSVFKRPARMHVLSASVEAGPAGSGLTVGAAGVCAKSDEAAARHEMPIDRKPHVRKKGVNSVAQGTVQVRMNKKVL